MDQERQPHPRKRKYEGPKPVARKPYHKETTKSPIEGLDMFTYDNGRMGSAEYSIASRKLIDYTGIHLPRVQSVVEYMTKKPPTMPKEPTNKDGSEPSRFQVERYNKDYTEYLKVLEDYKSQYRVLYNLIWTLLTTAMRHKVREDEDFEKYSEDKDALALWKEVKRLCFEDSQGGAPYILRSNRVNEARMTYQRLFQRENEPLGEFYERFIIEATAADQAGVRFGHLGDAEEIYQNIQDQEQKTDKKGMKIDFTEEQLSEMRERAESQAKEKDWAIGFLRKLNRKLYGSMIRELEDNLNNGQDLFPVTVAEAYRRANNRKPDANRKIPNIQNTVAFNTKGEPINKKNKQNVKCFLCNKTGHLQRDCNLLKKAVKFLEGQKGNNNNDSGECKVCIGTTQESGIINNEDLSYSVPAIVYKLTEADRKKLILNDNQATVSIMQDATLLTNIRKAPKPLRVNGIGKGSLICNEIGDFGDFKSSVYYHPQAGANIICFYDLQGQYRTTYDNQIANEFYVHTENGIAIFKPHGKLYAYEMEEDENVFITTVDENKAKYSADQLAKADLAHDIYINLQRPALKDFEQLIREGRLQNAPITVADIRRWIDIYGPDLGTLKGRTTRKTPHAVVPIVKPQRENKFVAVAADIFYIDSLPFLLVIELESKMLLCHYIPKRHHDILLEGFKFFKSILQEFNLNLDTVLMDGEGAANSFKTDLSSLGITMNCSSKGEHVPQIERAIRQVKERVRAAMAQIPYDKLDVMKIYLTFSCVSAINMFPREDRQESPREMVTGRKLDYKTDCQIQFGSYAQVHEDNEITNGMEARTTGAICLGPIYNAQGSYRFLSLATWKVIVRRSWTELPISSEIIALIGQRYAKESSYMESKKGRTNKKLKGAEARSKMTKQAPEEENEKGEVNVTQEVQEEEEEEIEQPEEVKITIEEVIEEEYEDEAYPIFLAVDTVEDNAQVYNMTVSNAIKQHGDVAIESIKKEVGQIIDKGCIKPVKYEDIPAEHKNKILRTIIFVKVKKDGRVKTRLVVDGRGQRHLEYEMSSYAPTARTESVFLTSAIEAKLGLEVTTADIEGAFLASEYPYYQVIRLGKEVTDIIVKNYPDWEPYVGYNGSLHAVMERAIYGNILSPALFNQHLSKSLTSIGFVKNPYDQGVFQREDGSCHIVVHVDDLKIAAKDAKVVEEVLAHLTSVYKKLIVTRGKVHEYLGMSINYTDEGNVIFNMTKMVQEVLNEYPMVKKSNSPASAELFTVNDSSPALSKANHEKFHSMVAKLLYLAKRARPDILLAVSYLTTRVKGPNVEDQKKLIKLIGYLHNTHDLKLTLFAEDPTQLHVYVDASHAVHHDKKSHTGFVATLGKGAIFVKSIKQKVVSKSSTVAEIYAVSDTLDEIIWAQNMLKSIGLKMKTLILHQDNKAAITIAEDGRNNQMKTRHLDIHHFYINDLVNKGEVKIVHTGTKHMLADTLTKPLQGIDFTNARDKLLNCNTALHTKGCVEERK